MQFIKQSIEHDVIRILSEDYDSEPCEERLSFIIVHEAKELLRTYDFSMTKVLRKGGYIDRSLFNINETHCQARVWNGGYGGQCSRKKQPECDLCGKHFGMSQSQNKLWLGKVTEERPQIPIYRGPNGDQNVPKKWKS